MAATSEKTTSAGHNGMLPSSNVVCKAQYIYLLNQTHTTIAFKHLTFHVSGKNWIFLTVTNDCDKLLPHDAIVSIYMGILEEGDSIVTVCRERHNKLPSVLWLGWLGVKKSMVLAWLFVWGNVRMICIWPRWCHCYPIISCFIKVQIGLTFLMPA